MAYSARVKKIIEFIELLTVPSGVGVGGPFKLRPWQKRFINHVYGPRNGADYRIVNQAIFSIARKNGKTALIAALVLVHLVGPEQEFNGEIYSAANDREQASIVFKYVEQLLMFEPELFNRVKVVASTKTVVNYQNGTVYRAISAEAGTKHGFNPTLVIYDELGQAKNTDLYHALDTAFGAREEPLMIVISTQNPDPQHILSELIDDGLAGHDPSTVVELHTVPDEVENIFDPKVWKLANPALGDFRLMADFKKKAARAKRMPSFETTFRNLYLNQRVDSKNPLIPRAEWTACKDPDLRLEAGEPVYLAIDLSSTTDLCALVALSAEDGDRAASWFWKPGDLIKEHEERDHVPYTTWARMELITTPAGRAIRYGHVAQKLAELHGIYDITGVAYDRWRVDLMLKELDDIGIEYWVEGKTDEREGALRMVPWGQGFKDMAPAIDALETAILERTLKHNGNPVLTWCVSNAMAVTDPAGNRKLDKSKSRFRIDGAQALTMAKGLKASDLLKEKGPSVYEERGILTL